MKLRLSRVCRVVAFVAGATLAHCGGSTVSPGDAASSGTHASESSSRGSSSSTHASSSGTGASSQSASSASSMSTSSASSSSASGGECLPSTCGTGDVCCLDTTTKLTACEMGTACSGGGIELCTANADCASSGSVCCVVGSSAPLGGCLSVSTCLALSGAGRCHPGDACPAGTGTCEKEECPGANGQVAVNVCSTNTECSPADAGGVSSSSASSGGHASSGSSSMSSGASSSGGSGSGS